MASVDGSKSLQRGSDEMFDNICGPCHQDNVENEANHYCVECGEYLCGQCKDYHRKLPLTKNHKIISGRKIPNIHTSIHGSGFFIYCACNKSQEVEVYCDDHEDIICSHCKIIKHHKCETVRIEVKSKSYTSAMLNSVQSRTKSIKDKFDQMKQERVKAVKELKLLKEGCKEEIKTFRKELNKYLDELEQNLQNDLDKRVNKYQAQLDNQISTLTSVMQMLDTDYKLLENAKRDGRNTTMLKTDVHVSKSLKDYETRFAEFEKDVKRPILSFERNKELDDILKSEIKMLGCLKETFHDKQMLLGRKILIQSSSQVDVRSANDQNSPWISGCTVMPSGHTVLCDRENKKIKMLNTTSVLQETLAVPGKPWDVSVIDGSNVIVSLPDKMQLHYIQVLPQMKAGRVIQLDKKCWGVDVADDEIYTTCHDDPGKGEVRILSLDGKMIQRLGVKQDGSFKFTNPYYISVSPSSGKIYVSDDRSSMITCMTVDETIIYKYKDAELNIPLGLYVDAGDNVFVCGRISHNVQVITADGRKNDTLLSFSHGLNGPYSIAYRESGETFVVGCREGDRRFNLFKLAT